MGPFTKLSLLCYSCAVWGLNSPLLQLLTYTPADDQSRSDHSVVRGPCVIGPCGHRPIWRECHSIRQVCHVGRRQAVRDQPVDHFGRHVTRTRAEGRRRFRPLPRSIRLTKTACHSVAFWIHTAYIWRAWDSVSGPYTARGCSR